MSISPFKLSVFLYAAFLTVAASADVESPESVDSRISFVDKLITESSAARQVEASDNDDAKRLHEEASTHFDAAIDARAAGEIEIASARLTDAIRSMYAAVDAAGDTPQKTDSDNRHYEQRVASIDALMSAHERITKEKGLKHVQQDLQMSVAGDVAAANKFHNEGNTEQASAHLDAAYEKVTHAVEKLRQGETLVRELHFETEEAEYLYELDRNDTHEMLVNLLVENGTAGPGTKEQAKQRVAAAVVLRRKAECLARDRKYGEAITVLEQSTSELVKAIRGAGVYIPG